jgi:ribosome modulation factor
MTIKNEGREAFLRGIGAGDVPYADIERRILWVTGWSQSKVDHEHRRNISQITKAA